MLLALLLAAQTPPYSATLLGALDSAAGPKWMRHEMKELRLAKGGAIVTLELAIDTKGAVTSIGLEHSCGTNALDDLARRLVLAAEPLPAPAALQRCLARLLLQAQPKPKITAALACFAAGATVPELAGKATGDDAAALLLTGYEQEAAGEAAHVVTYERAARSGWDEAHRAYGLALVKAKRVDDAMPHLEAYVQSRTPGEEVAALGREIERYAAFKKSKEAEANRVRDRLTNADIGAGIKKGYALLEPCLVRARTAQALAVGTDTLLLTWTIHKDGTVSQARLDGPKPLLMTDHAECIEAAVGSWIFAKFSQGTEVTAKGVPIKVKGSPELVAAAAAAGARTPAPASAELIESEPTFSTCSRTEQEIGGYIQRQLAALNRCVQEEKKRMPNAPLPEQLPVSFVIDVDGTIRGVGVRHRHYRDGLLAVCVARALSGSLAPAAGADCPAEFALDLRGR